MAEVAQTNLQLYNQLIAAGWSDANLDRTQAAYALAADLFAGQIRSSGKTFLEHLVGTASAVAAVGGRPALVHAALLHATFNLFQSGYEIVEHEAIRLPIESLEEVRPHAPAVRL